MLEQKSFAQKSCPNCDKHHHFNSFRVSQRGGQAPDSGRTGGGQRPDRAGHAALKPKLGRRGSVGVFPDLPFSLLFA